MFAKKIWSKLRGKNAKEKWTLVNSDGDSISDSSSSDSSICDNDNCTCPYHQRRMKKKKQKDERKKYKHRKHIEESFEGFTKGKPKDQSCQTISPDIKENPPGERRESLSDNSKPESIKSDEQDNLGGALGIDDEFLLTRLHTVAIERLKVFDFSYYNGHISSEDSNRSRDSLSSGDAIRSRGCRDRRNHESEVKDESGSSHSGYSSSANDSSYGSGISCISSRYGRTTKVHKLKQKVEPETHTSPTSPTLIQLQNQRISKKAQLTESLSPPTESPTKHDGPHATVFEPPKRSDMSFRSEIKEHSNNSHISTANPCKQDLKGYSTQFVRSKPKVIKLRKRKKGKMGVSLQFDGGNHSGGRQTFTTNPSKHDEPYVQIIEQPMTVGMPFRFEGENHSDDCLHGENSSKDKEMFPCIGVCNFNGPVEVKVSCVSVDEPYVPHPNMLVGNKCEKGVCFLSVSKSEMITLPKLWIECVRTNDVENNLNLRQTVNLDPYQTGFKHEGRRLDFNAVRLCFQVFFLDKDGKIIRTAKPVVSNPIHANRQMHWEEALEGKKEEVISELLKCISLSTPAYIKEACEVLGSRSDEMKRILHELCLWMKTLDSNIYSVEPTYKSDSPGDVVFLVYVHQLNDDFQFVVPGVEFVVRCSGQYSEEGTAIVDAEAIAGHRFTLEQSTKLTNCLEKYSETLMEKHSNLQMVSASHLKSRKHGQVDSIKEHCMCIVFYVAVKGYIPWSEEELPRTLDGIPTDVREGGFKFLASAKDRHNDLKMGCEIAGDRNFNGTLGPFFHQDGNTYCLTAGHVLYGDPPPGLQSHKWPSLSSGELQPISVYQPNPRRSPQWKQDPFGSVWSAIYKSGGGKEPGLDLAIIVIQDKDRIPLSGEFPESELEEDTPMEVEGIAEAANRPHQPMVYHTGLVCDKAYFENNAYNGVTVSKFGATTGETQAIIHISGTCVRHNCVQNDQGNILLFKQIELSKSIDGHIFAAPGDSGSVILVAYGGNRNDLRALGLLIGQSSTGTILATPMYAILDHLGFKERRLMKFPKPPIYPSISSDSGIGSGSPLLAMGEMQEKLLMHEQRMDTIEKVTGEIKRDVHQLSTKFDSFAGQMMLMMQQIVPTNNICAAGDQN